MLAWHGTNQMFDAFDLSALGSANDNAASRVAFFFATDRDTAVDYAHKAARSMVPDQAAHEARVAALLSRSEEALRKGREDLYERLIIEAEDLEACAMRDAAQGGPHEVAFDGWDMDGLHATLDFIETEDGLAFLEGGPACMPGGGGHPTAFAGQNVDRTDPTRLVPPCEGVAYLCMAHVNLGEPKTWVDGDGSEVFDTWEAAASLAADHAPIDDDMQAFLDRVTQDAKFDVSPGF